MKHQNLRPALGMLLAAALFAGCSSTPAPRFHSLLPTQATGAADAAASSVPLPLDLGPVSVPPAVDQQQWVVRLPDDSLREDFQRQNLPSSPVPHGPDLAAASSTEAPNGLVALGKVTHGRLRSQKLIATAQLGDPPRQRQRVVRVGLQRLSRTERQHAVALRERG